MDPKACLLMADQDVSNGNLEDAARRLCDYHGWRDRGGSEPISMGWHPDCSGDTFAVEVRNRLADRVAQLAQEVDRLPRCGRVTP